MNIRSLVTSILLCSAYISVSNSVSAQNMFSMAAQHPADTSRSDAHEQAIRFPSLRQASVTVDLYGSGHFDSRLNDKDLASGKSRNARISSYFTAAFGSWNGNAIGATIYHTENFFDVRNADNKLADPRVNTGSSSKSTFGLSLNFSRTDAIFHTPVIYSAVFTGISDNLSTIRRFNFNGGVSFPLMHTADSYLSVGVLLLIDPSAPIPILPVVNYFQRLNGRGLALAIDLPQGVSIRQSLSRNAWVYLGSNYNTYASFYKSDNASLPGRYSYNTIEFKSGPGFEYLFGKYVIVGISGGVNSTISARVWAKGDRYNTPLIKTTNRATPYGEFRISLLPF